MPRRERPRYVLMKSHPPTIIDVDTGLAVCQVCPQPGNPYAAIGVPDSGEETARWLVDLMNRDEEMRAQVDATVRRS